MPLLLVPQSAAVTGAPPAIYQIVTANSAAATVTSLGIVIPAGAPIGAAIVLIAHGVNTGTLFDTPPSGGAGGWTQDRNAVYASSTIVVGAWHKAVAAGDPGATITVSTGATARAKVLALAILSNGGFDAVGSDVTTTVAATSMPNGGVTDSVSNETLVNFLCWRASTTNTTRDQTAAPSGFTEQAEPQNTTSSNRGGITVNSRIGVGSGAQTVANSTYDVAVTAVSLTYAIKPTGGGPTNVTLGQPSETDAAQPIGRSKSESIGQAAQVDIGQPIGRSKSKLIGQAAEIDTVTTVGRTAQKTLGQPSEIDTVTTVGRSERKTLGQPSEIDTVTSITRPGAFRQVTESDTAQSITRVEQKTFGQSAESETAQPVGRLRGRTLGQPSEIDTVTTVGRAERKTLGQPSETDTVTTVGRTERKTLGQPFEIDESQALPHGTRVTLGQPSETDAAQPIGARKSLNRGAEADTAQGIARRRSYAAAQLTETDTAQGITRRRTRTAAQAVETSAVQPIKRLRSRTLGQATEAETARPVTPLGRVGQALEADTAQPIGRLKRKGAGQALSGPQTAQPVARAHSRVLGQPGATEAAQGVARRKFHGVAPAAELNSAVPVTFGAGGTVGPATGAIAPSVGAAFLDAPSVGANAGAIATVKSS